MKRHIPIIDVILFSPVDDTKLILQFLPPNSIKPLLNKPPKRINTCSSLLFITSSKLSRNVWIPGSCLLVVWENIIPDDIKATCLTK